MKLSPRAEMRLKLLSLYEATRPLETHPEIEGIRNKLNDALSDLVEPLGMSFARQIRKECRKDIKRIAEIIFNPPNAKETFEGDEVAPQSDREEWFDSEPPESGERKKNEVSDTIPAPAAYPPDHNLSTKHHFIMPPPSRDSDEWFT